MDSLIVLMYVMFSVVRIDFKFIFGFMFVCFIVLVFLCKVVMILLILVVLDMIFLLINCLVI